MLLSTKAKYKAFAGIGAAVTTYDAALDMILPSVSDLIQERCNRIFGTATYRTWLDGSGKATMRLPDWPITRLYGMATFGQTALTLTFTGGSRAMVANDGTNINLFSVSDAGAETDVAIALTGFKTITLLAAEIETNTGWAATVASEMASEYSLVLKPIDSAWALTPQTMDLEIPDDGENVRTMSETEATIERPGGTRFPVGRSNIFVWFTAGYTLPVKDEADVDAGNVPRGLELIVNQVVGETLRLGKVNTAMKSETIGRYKYTLSDAVVGGKGTLIGLIEKHASDLSPYIRRSV